VLNLYRSGRDNLRAVGAVLGGVPEARIDEVLELVKLQGRDKDRVKTYSLGMKQQLGVAMALLQDPDVLILDEPANGLDPAGIVEVRDLTRARRGGQDRLHLQPRAQRAAADLHARDHPQPGRAGHGDDR
jgi:ABC-2 type transport system ATP-binding protein